MAHFVVRLQHCLHRKRDIDTGVLVQAEPRPGYSIQTSPHAWVCARAPCRMRAGPRQNSHIPRRLYFDRASVPNRDCFSCAQPSSQRRARRHTLSEDATIADTHRHVCGVVHFPGESDSTHQLVHLSASAASDQVSSVFVSVGDLCFGNFAGRELLSRFSAHGQHRAGEGRLYKLTRQYVATYLALWRSHISSRRRRSSVRRCCSCSRAAAYRA